MKEELTVKVKIIQAIGWMLFPFEFEVPLWLKLGHPQFYETWSIVYGLGALAMFTAVLFMIIKSI